MLLLSLARGRRRLEADLAAARSDVQGLRERLDQLSAQNAACPSSTRGLPVTQEYLITTAGTVGPTPTVVPDRAVLSLTLGRPLVKMAAFAYGVGRALSPENRNRIAFEMRREVKRSRKQRRREQRRRTPAPGASPEERAA
jgi:hypothetical protein